MSTYIYDLNADEKKLYNRSKRMFYYYLNQILSPEVKIISKSTLVVPETLESVYDNFFLKWKNKIIVYKIHSNNFERIV